MISSRVHTKECQFHIISSRHLDSQSLSSPRRSMKSSSNVTRNIQVIWSTCVSRSKTIHISRHLIIQLAGKQIPKLPKSFRFCLCSCMIHDWRSKWHCRRTFPCTNNFKDEKETESRTQREREMERKTSNIWWTGCKKGTYKVIREERKSLVIERKGVSLKVETITCWNITIPWRVKSKRSNYEMIWYSKTIRVIWHFLRNTQETLSLTANILMDRL